MELISSKKSLVYFENLNLESRERIRQMLLLIILLSDILLVIITGFMVHTVFLK